MSYKEINIQNWKRKDIFMLFKNYDDPYFNITFEVDVSHLYRQCRYKKISFFLASLYFSTKAANVIEGFKLRFKEEKVICYDKVDLGSTILLENQTFTFCYFDFVNDFSVFHNNGRKKIENIKSTISFEPKDDKFDIIHYSVIPWIPLTAFKHARNLNKLDAVPKIVFGKVNEAFNKKMMPVSVELHHALADGWDAGQYYELFQKELNAAFL